MTPSTDEESVQENLPKSWSLLWKELGFGLLFRLLPLVSDHKVSIFKEHLGS